MHSVRVCQFLFRRLLIFWGIIFFPVASFLQAQASVSGSVADDAGQPVAYANVLVLSAADSSLIRGAVTADDGSFEMHIPGSGPFILKVMMVGFSDINSAPFSLGAGEDSKEFGSMILHEDAVLMNEVQVIAKKPLFEQKVDRMVINVASSITSSGLTILEVLERSPGVMINRQSNSISLSGKSGVVVMINGRINYMPADAVTQLLDGMSSDNIEKIEIITTPPAGFDAEGNAGYINIILKNNLDDGLSGSYAFMAGYGKGEVGNASINFNYRKGKYNLFGDYNYVHDAQEQVFDFYRSINLNGDQIETATRSDRDPERNNHAARLGLDYQVNEKFLIGGLLSGFNTKWEMDADNIAEISSNGHLDTVITIDNEELNQWKNIGANINAQYTFKEGQVLKMDGDYLYYNDNNPTYYNNHYADGEGNFLYENYTRASKMTPISIAVGKVDYLTPIGKNMKLETGVKGTISSFTNDVGVEYSNTGQDWVTDPDLTNKYDLLEKIGAAYFSMESPLGKKTTLKFGLRYEYTDSNLGSQEEENIVDREFGAFFPSFYISRSLRENSAVNFSYGRRITRPTFNDMAPFVIFLDPYTFFSGNPAVQPAISNNLELAYSFKSAIISLKYSVEDSAIANFQSTIIEGTNTQLIFTENLKQVTTYSLTFSTPVTPFKWWNMYYNIGGAWQVAEKYQEDQLETYEAGSINFFSTQTFTLPKEFTFEISGYYSGGGLFGIFTIKPFGSLNLGLQKKFGEDGGTFRIGFDNLLDTEAYQDELDLPEQQEYYKAYLQFSQPTLKLSYTRNFGNQKMKETRSHSTGAEEEKRRINN